MARKRDFLGGSIRSARSVFQFEDYPLAYELFKPFVDFYGVWCKLSSYQRSFKFLATCTCHADYKQVVNDNWDFNKSILENIPHLTKAFTKWNADCFGNIHTKKKESLSRLEGIQRKLAFEHESGLIKLEGKVRD